MTSSIALHTNLTNLSAAAIMVGIGGIIWEESRSRHLFITEHAGPLVTVMSGERGGNGYAPYEAWSTQVWLDTAADEYDEDDHDDDESTWQGVHYDQSDDSRADFRAAYLSDGRPVEDVIAEAAPPVITAAEAEPTTTAARLLPGMLVSATDEGYRVSTLRDRGAVTDMKVNRITPSGTENYTRVYWGKDGLDYGHEWSFPSDATFTIHSGHEWSFPSDATFTIHSAPGEAETARPSASVGTVIDGPTALVAAGVGGRIKAHRSGNEYYVTELPTAADETGRVKRVSDGHEIEPSIDITWTILAVAGEVQAAEAVDVETDDGPKTVTVTAENLAAGMFAVPTNNTILSHGLRRNGGLARGLTVLTNARESSNWRHLTFEATDGGRRETWIFRNSDTFDVTTYSELDLAKWLVAEAKHQATVSTLDAMNRAEAERAAFHEAIVAARTRAEATERTAMTERNAMRDDRDRLRDELAKVTKLWTPGGIINKVACMRGDLTSQCAELDRTLRGIGWYDRDGMNQAGDRWHEADEANERDGEYRGWYKSRWTVTVPRVVATINDTRVSLENVDVVVTAGDEHRAADKVGVSEVAAALTKTFGVEVYYNQIDDMSSRREMSAEAAEGSYTVADWTD